MLHKKWISLALAGALLCIPAAAYTATENNLMDVTSAQYLTDMSAALTQAGAAALPNPTVSGNIAVGVYQDASFRINTQDGKVLSLAADWLLSDTAQAESFGQLLGAMLQVTVPDQPFALINNELEIENVEETGLRSYYAKPLLLTFEVTQEKARFAVTVPPQAQQGIQLSVNDRFLTLDTAPVIENGRTLVPLRGIFEAIGATVTWDNANRTAVISRDSLEIKVPIGSQTASVNGEARTLEVPAKIIEGRTLVPVRFIAEAMGAQVGWNNEKQIVLISI